MCAQVLQCCPTFGDSTDCSPPGSCLSMGFNPLEWVAMPSSRGSSQSMDQTRVSYVSRIGRRVFYPLSYLGSPWIHSPLIVKNLVNSKTGISFPFSGYINFLFDGLPWWLSWKRICLQYGRPRFHSWVRKILWRRERPPTPLFWSGEFLGLYSPWGLKESDTTERLSLSLSFLVAKPRT